MQPFLEHHADPPKNTALVLSAVWMEAGNLISIQPFSGGVFFQSQMNDQTGNVGAFEETISGEEI